MASLDKAKKKLDWFKKSSDVSLAGIGRAFASVAVGAATAFGAMAKRSIDSADRLLELKQATGVSVESLSQLQYAASLSGVQMETLTGSIAKLSRNAVVAAQDLNGKVSKAFQSLGVNVVDSSGKMQDSEEILLQVADKFAAMEDGAAKTALAMQLFGRSGAQLIPFLNEGRAGLEKLRKEADALGLTISDNAAVAADQFNDNLTRLKGAASGITNQLAQEMLPTLNTLTENFITSAQEGGTLNIAVTALAGTFKGLITVGVAANGIFRSFGILISRTIEALDHIQKFEFSEALDSLKSGFADASDAAIDDMETIARIWSNTAPEIIATGNDIDKALGETLLFNDEKAKAAAEKAAKSALEQLTTLETGLRQQVATFGMAEGAVIRYNIAQGELAGTFAAAGAAADPLKGAIITLTDNLAELTAEAERAKKATEEWQSVVDLGKEVTESAASPLERYNAEMERLTLLNELGVIGWETLARKQIEAKESILGVVDPMAQYNRALVELSEQLDANAITQEEASKRAKEAQDTYYKAITQNNDFLRKASENVQDIIADSLVNGFEDGAKGMLRTFVNMLLEMQAQALAAKIATAIFGDGVGGGKGILGAIVGAIGTSKGVPVKDSGGRGKAREPVLIGTGAQPEMFVPDVAGTFYTRQQQASAMFSSRDGGGRGYPGSRYVSGPRAQPEMFIPDKPSSYFAAPQQAAAPQITLSPQIINVRDPSEIPKAMQGPEGEQSIINIINRNPGVIRNILQR
jgi:hypothetical protein